MVRQRRWLRNKPWTDRDQIISDDFNQIKVKFDYHWLVPPSNVCDVLYYFVIISMLIYTRSYVGLIDGNHTLLTLLSYINFRLKPRHWSICQAQNNNIYTSTWHCNIILVIFYVTYLTICMQYVFSFNTWTILQPITHIL